MFDLIWRRCDSTEESSESENDRQVALYISVSVAVYNEGGGDKTLRHSLSLSLHRPKHKEEEKDCILYISIPSSLSGHTSPGFRTRRACSYSVIIWRFSSLLLLHSSTCSPQRSPADTTLRRVMAKDPERNSCLLRDLRQRAGNELCADCGAAGKSISPGLQRFEAPHLLEAQS